MAESGRIVDNIIVNSNKFNNSFFREFFTVLDPEVLTWALTVLEKLYDRGILADYLERNKGEGNLFQDEDFISFFFSKTHFYAILVTYARLFEDIEDNDTLKREFLKNIGLYVAIDQSTEDLDYIYNNYVSEFEKRGTDFVHYLKGQEGAEVDGEILRLLNHKSSDEFVFALLGNEDIGWNLGNSSPTYTGTDKIINLTKAYELTEDVENLALYPIQNPTYVALDNGYIRITNPSGSKAGLRYDADLTKRIVVDHRVSYEMSFKLTVDDPSIFTFDFELGVDSYNVNGSSLGLLNNQDGVPSNNFYTGTSSIFKVAETEYWVRCVIFSVDTVNDGGELLNVGYGNNLRFQEGVNYIVPKILCGNFSNAAGEIIIRDFKFRPAILPFSLGMLGVKNFIINYVENFSGRFTDNIEDIIKQELIPYNSIYKPIFIEDADTTSSTSIIPVPNSGASATTDWLNVAGTPNGWTGSDDGEILSVENPVVGFTNNVFKINSPTSDATLETDSFAIVSGKTYKLRLKYWVPTLFTMEAEINAVFSGAPNPLILSFGMSTTAVTVVESDSFVAPTGAMQLELYMATTGILYIDELELVEQ